MGKSLERLFRPKSIAVFGGREAAQVIVQSDRMGFAGNIWPVHPTRDEMHGRRCFRSVAELPDAPDAAFIGVNRTRTVDIVRELAARGAGGAICYASGFREASDGAALEEALLRAAGEMPVIGPNCYGIINYVDGALLWPDQHGGARVQRGVAIVTQSSNIALNMTMQRRGLPLAYVATAGNQAQTDLAEIALGFLDDPRVTAIGLHIEGVKNVAAFEAMARSARARGKPIVAMTVGRSEQSRAATISHTASIVGSEVAAAAYFDRLAIPRLRFIPEFLETLKLLHVHGPLTGGDLASMSCSGGEASIMADAAVGRKIRYRPLDAGERARVKATLSDLVTIANPLDYHTFVWAKEGDMAATFAAMIGCGFDLSMLVLDFPRLDRCSDADWDIAVRAIAHAAAATGGRTAVVASLPENMPEERAAELLAQNIAPLCGINEALGAAEAAAFIGLRWKEPLPAPVLAAAPAAAAPQRVLFEAEAKQALADFGVPVPRSRAVCDPRQAAAAADELGYPVVLKAVGIAHKSETGAVRLNLQSAAEVENAAQDFARVGTGLLVERMVTDAVAELLIGVTRDPQLGLLMTIGAGGVLVELLGDAASLLLPATEEEIRRAILSLKTAPLLQGFRGRPRGDLDAAIAAAVAAARYAEAHAEVLEELEINPLLVRPYGHGAVAVDALIRIREAA
jgi:acyl-CoA synthetase (NDP forming)